jgi:cytochrome c biogenesis protein CcdA
MHIGSRLTGAALALLWLLAGSPGSAQPGQIRVELDDLLETDAAHAGTRVRAALQVRLEPGYHVNSDEPLDPYLIPTVLSLAPPEGIGAAAVAYPEASLLNQVGAPEPLAVFEEVFVIGVAFDLAPGLAPGSYVVPATLQYQACDERMCYRPSSATAGFRIEVVAGDRALTPLHAEVFAAMTFSAEDEANVRLATAAEAPLVVPAAPAAAGGGDVMSALDGFEVLATTGGYLPADEFLGFVSAAESGEAQRGLLEGRGPMAILLIILIGGLALNLTPCVLPMIPINLAIIGAGARAGSRLRGFLLGSTYGAAMAVAYGLLGLIVIRTAGTFGTLNASPWFNLAIAAIFIVLALAMFDLLLIDFSRWQSKVHFGEGGKGSYVVAFGMGAVAALLAGACVAPVVIQVILFSSSLYATGTMLALALPFVLGLGMALPWPLAGAGLSLMPKPGPWMVRVKQAFGVFILATAAYYGYLSYTLFADRWVDAAEVRSGVEELLSEGWYADMEQGLQTAKAEDKLVLVDLWATWCKNCLVMDRTTLQDPAVRTALDDYVKIKFQAEDPGVTPAREVMERFRAIGLPAYAILRPAADQP